MEQFPVNDTDLIEEIKNLINEKGLEVITSKIIRNHIESKFKCDTEKYKSHLDNLTEQCISDYLKEKEDNKNEEDEEMDKAKEEMNSDEKQRSKGSPISSGICDVEDNIKKPSKNSQALNNTKNKKGNKRKTIDNEPTTSSTLFQQNDEDMLSSIKRRRSAASLPSKKRGTKVKDKKDKGTTRKRETQFTKVCALSPELSELLGKSYMRRSDVVKGVWAYLKSNNLQDPKKKQFYFLDGPLKKIFGSTKTKFKAFGMMGDLNKHVKDVQFLDTESRRIAEAEIAKMLKEEEKGEKLNQLNEGVEDDEGSDDGGNRESNKSTNKKDDDGDDNFDKLNNSEEDQSKINNTDNNSELSNNSNNDDEKSFCSSSDGEED